MATTLKKFSDAYASMTVATYEPLILKWVSFWAVSTMASTMASRLQKAKYYQENLKYPTAQALNLTRVDKNRLPRVLTDLKLESNPLPSTIVNNAGEQVLNANIKPVSIEGFPNAVAIGEKIYPHGVLRTNQQSTSRQTATAIGTRQIPAVINKGSGTVDPDFDFRKAHKQVFTKLIGALDVATQATDVSLIDTLRGAIQDVSGKTIYEFWPAQKIEEALSPIGIAHFYRQLYFNLEEGYGPIEEAFTIAPLETLEVVYQTVRRQVHEEVIETGLETVLESSIESRNLEEVSDKVSSMIQRDSSASMSANASGTIGVWSVGASASASMATSSQRGREESSRRLKEVTKRASERIRKSFSIKTREIDELTTTNFRRRVIQNNSESPVSYGLRRVLTKVRVKVQDLGPQLVWQSYIKNPGKGLARSRFVHFREAELIAPPDVPPGVRPRPKEGTDVGSTSVSLEYDSNLETWYVTLVVQTGGDRIITGVSIDSITDLEGGGCDDEAPSARNDIKIGEDIWDENSNTYTTKIAVLAGDSRNGSVTYTYTYKPSQKALAEWDAEREAARQKITEELLNQKFEREKAIITEKSRIPKRPANDLRKEERYEVMNRMVSELFGRGDDPSQPIPLEIEYFHRYFDIDGMFIYTHPSWWKPRYAPVSTSMSRTAYAITADSDPAPMGSSLGWKIQEDGDTRRNEFINSPWLRVCLPMRSGLEKEAIAWLSKHIEGTYGFDTEDGPLKDLLDEVEEYRGREEALGVDGPNYVEVDSTVGAPTDPATPEGVYPLVNEFDIVLPTDGFVYDELNLD